MAMGKRAGAVRVAALCAMAWVLQDAFSMTVSFGKHRGKTMQELMEEDPGYCSWMLQTYREDKENCNPALQAAAEYLLDQDDIDVEELEQVINFGKYKGQGFKQVMDEDPDYGQWVVGAAEESANPNFRAFAEFAGEYLEKAEAQASA
mmetsp:Transcript_6866/g.16272  ORF Transcript_6866/g.16272 Transcript_6866/m.16272 type:complete len:148 (+) Transcript_6866:53-496(+)|eukprot:CAMPEP_0181453690 /NCGR_PEP_ID=MMETSP1110-20121109/29854_1 /TAXON_ID=174948 /ORGANISM="Symbiodinium sp., Strain CCMP421" /LENGTH=147 /DNA_ID=CAMNT_0023578015 /DNA_START=41 /DNA_END=484 /DNA_ORIENTATION=+